MGFLQRLLGAALGIVLLVAAFVFASLVLAVLLVAGLGLWAWLWWRSRKMPRQKAAGAVIEGEYRDETPSQRIKDRGRL
jgi:HAMP domain-containing protein